MNKNEIIIFEEQGIKLEVDRDDETVWLTQKQMALLFDKDVNTINEHITNIFKEGELDEKTSTGISGKSTGGRKPKKYNLDVIISVGYRVKSQNGIIFRKWANKVLRDYLLKGYAINEKRLAYYNKTIQLIEIANRTNVDYENEEAASILKIINNFSIAFNLLDEYDKKIITKPNGTDSNRKIKYEDCTNIIDELRVKEKSTIFAIERSAGLRSIIKNIYQTYNGEPLYKSTEEKAANFLYMIIKDHIFIDGNKRIGATLFIYFLNYYDILYKDDKEIISNSSLVALTLLIAESNPDEKQLIIDLIMNIIS